MSHGLYQYRCIYAVGLWETCSGFWRGGNCYNTEKTAWKHRGKDYKVLGVEMFYLNYRNRDTIVWFKAKS
jgi:hypothetical protein